MIKAIHSASKILNSVGAVFLAAMMLLTVGDVVGRYFLNRPILGTVELTGFMLIFIYFLGLGYAAATKSHISIDVVTQHLSEKTKAVLLCLAYLISTGVAASVTLAAALQVSRKLSEIP